MKDQPLATQDPALFSFEEETGVVLSADRSARQDSEFLGRFSDIAMFAADWFWEMDENLRFTYQSNRFEEVTGLPVDSVIGKTREEAFVGLMDNAAKWKELGHELNCAQQLFDGVVFKTF